MGQVEPTKATELTSADIPVELPLPSIEATELASFHLPFEAFSLARSEDGRFIAVSGDYGALLLLDYQQHRETSGAVRHALTQLGRWSLAVDRQGPTHADESDTSEDDEFLPDMPSSSHAMCNSVRWCQVLGAERLLVGLQLGSAGYVVFLDRPDARPLSDDPVQRARSIQCSLHEGGGGGRRRFRGGLVQGPTPTHLTEGKASGSILLFAPPWHPQQSPVRLPLPLSQVPVFSRGIAGAGTFDTAAAGPFNTPINFCLASPDGRMIAACTDSDYLLLLKADSGFAPAAAVRRMLEPRVDYINMHSGSGSQYLAWSPDSSHVAVTNDRLRYLLVIDVNNLKTVAQ